MPKQLSRSELRLLLELSSRCLSVTVPEQLEAIISSIYDLTAYCKAALCTFSVEPNALTLTHFVNHSYGAQWADLYVHQNFQRADPILVHASTTSGAFRWDEAAPAEASAAFFEAAQAFGLAHGMSFSCAGPAPDFRSVLSFAGVPSRELERARQILSLIGPHLHECYRRLLAARAEQRSPTELAVPAHSELSARELEVLRWAQHGKTHWEIGAILGISQRTVKFHVARIKAKLDVVSTAHAIAKAMSSGLIS